MICINLYWMLTDYIWSWLYQDCFIFSTRETRWFWNSFRVFLESHYVYPSDNFFLMEKLMNTKESAFYDLYIFNFLYIYLLLFWTFRVRLGSEHTKYWIRIRCCVIYGLWFFLHCNLRDFKDTLLRGMCPKIVSFSA